MPSFELYILLIAVVGNLLLGLIPFYRNAKSATNKLFAFLTITIVIYLFANYLSLHQHSVPSTIFWVKTVMSVTLFVNLSFFLLATTYPSENFRIETKWIWMLVVVTFVLSLLSQTSLFFSSVIVEAGKVQVNPGPLILLFLLHTILGLGAGMYLMIKKLRRSSGAEKGQLRPLLVCAASIFILILFSNLILVLVFGNSRFTVLMSIYTLVFIGYISYAIAKHGLFNLKALATQLLVAILWVVLFARIFVAQTLTGALIDLLIFVVVVVFGILLIRSVLQEVEQREKLQELTEKLKVMDKQKDEFLSMAAHELRAPMTAIKGYVSMVMEGDTGEISEKARGFLADTNNITDRLIRLVNNMLNVSRIEEGRLTFQEEEEHLAIPVRSVFSQFIPEAERKGLKYTLKIPKQIKDKVEVDPDRIQEVIGNFISNAVKYTDEGFVEVRMSQPGKNSVRVEVADSGPGISKEEQLKLFHKFERVESNVGKTTGTGLGLYISKLLVEKFKGKIDVDSETGEGSVFWFELPLIS
jgi:signal transduction histidine kinase